MGHQRSGVGGTTIVSAPLALQLLNPTIGQKNLVYNTSNGAVVALGFL
jgi:hypothetical protein